MSDWIAFTGISKGIGLKLSKLYKDAGYKILNIGRHPSANQDMSIFWDLSTEPSQNTVTDLKSFFSENSPPKLINCAGVLGPSEEDFLNIDENLYYKKYHDAFTTNFLSQVRLSKLFMMSIDRKCLKINPILMHLSSGAALHPEKYFGLDAYSLSKSAILNWFTNQASFHRKEFYFLSIAPGVIRTSMVEEILNLKKDYFPSHDKFKDIERKNAFIDIDLACNTLFTILNTAEYLEKYNGSFLDLRETSIYT